MPRDELHDPDFKVVRLEITAFHRVLRDMFVGYTSRWRKVEASKLDATSEHALGTLKEAGLVELRQGVEVRWIGYPYLLWSIFETCGENADGELDREVNTLIRLAPGWIDEDAFLCDENPDHPLRIHVFPMAARLSARGAVFSAPEYSPSEILQMMAMLTAGMLPPATPSVRLVDWSTFVPTELQKDIWTTLAGQALTADALEAKVAVARSTLFRKEGGLPEMLGLRLVQNDRKRGGYYRPDAPPKSN